jgi:hypothetical protein
MFDMLQCAFTVCEAHQRDAQRVCLSLERSALNLCPRLPFSP